VKVTLPDNLVNNAATVEIWYDKYVPEGHLLIDIEIPIESEEPQELIVGVMPTDELDDEEARAAAYLAPQQEIVGSGNSLDYVGKDEPNEEASEEDENEQDISEEEYLRRKENGGTFASDVEDSPKGGY
jgi:hypothetical protein